MKRIIRILLVALMVLGTSTSLLATPPQSAIEKAKASVETISPQLPVDCNTLLTWTKISYDSEKYALVYQYRYKVAVTKPSEETIKENRLAAIHLIKGNPNSGDLELIKSGITFVFNYYTKEGNFLFSSQITAEDF